MAVVSEYIAGVFGVNEDAVSARQYERKWVVCTHACVKVGSLARTCCLSLVTSASWNPVASGEVGKTEWNSDSAV